MWPQRSRHFLRIGKRRFITLLLLTELKHFEQASFDLILSVLYDRLPQELTPDPQNGNPLVVSPFNMQKPYRYSHDGLEFSYYWVVPTSDCSIIAPRAKPTLLEEGDYSSKDNLQQANQTLVICVHAAPKNKNFIAPEATAETDVEDPLLDLGAIARASTLDRFFAREGSSSHLSGPSSQSSQAGSPS